MDDTKSTAPFPRVRRPKLNIWASWKKEEEKRHEREQAKNGSIDVAPVTRTDNKREEAVPKGVRNGERGVWVEKQEGNDVPVWVSEWVIPPQALSSPVGEGSALPYFSRVPEPPVDAAPVVGRTTRKVVVSAGEARRENAFSRSGPQREGEEEEDGEKEMRRPGAVPPSGASAKPPDAPKETKWPSPRTSHTNASSIASPLRPSSQCASSLSHATPSGSPSFPHAAPPLPRRRSSPLQEEDTVHWSAMEDTEMDSSRLERPSIIKVVDEIPPSFRDFVQHSPSRVRRQRRGVPPRRSNANTNPIPEKPKGGPQDFQKCRKGEASPSTSAVASPHLFSSSTLPATFPASFTSSSLKTTLHSGREALDGSGRGAPGSNEWPRSAEEQESHSGRVHRQRLRYSNEKWTPHVVSDLHATLTGSPHSTFESIHSPDGSTNFSKSNPATDSNRRSFATSFGFPLERTLRSVNSTLNLNDTLGRAVRAEMLENVPFVDDDAPQGISPLRTDEKRHADDLERVPPHHPRGGEETAKDLLGSSSSVSPPSSRVALADGLEALKAAVRLGDALADEEAWEAQDGADASEWGESGVAPPPPPPPPPSAAASSAVAPFSPPSQRRETVWQRKSVAGGVFPPTSSSSPVAVSPTATGPRLPRSTAATAFVPNASHPLAYTQQMQPSARTKAAIGRLGASPTLMQNDLTVGEGLTVDRLRRWFGPSTLLRRFRYKRHHGPPREGRVEEGEDGSSFRHGGGRTPSCRVGPTPPPPPLGKDETQKAGVIAYVDDRCSVWSEASALGQAHPFTDRITRRHVSSRGEDRSLVSSPFHRRGHTRARWASPDSISLGGMQGSAHGLPRHPLPLGDPEGRRAGNEEREAGTAVSLPPAVTPTRVHAERRQPPLPTWKWKKNAKGEEVIVGASRNLLLYEHYTKYGTFPAFYTAEKTSDEEEGDDEGRKKRKKKKAGGMKGACALQREGAALLHHAVENGVRCIQQMALEKPKESAIIRLVRHWCDRSSVERQKEDGSVVDDPRMAHEDVMARVIMEEEKARSQQHFSRLRYREKMRLESSAARGEKRGVWMQEQEGNDCCLPQNCSDAFGRMPTAAHPMDHPPSAGQGAASPPWSSSAGMRWKEDHFPFPAKPFTANPLVSHKALCSRFNPFDIPSEERDKYTSEFASLHPFATEEEWMERQSVGDGAEEKASSAHRLSRNSFSSSMIANDSMDLSYRSSFSGSLSPVMSPLGFSSSLPAAPASFLSMDEGDVALRGGGGGLPSPVETALLDLLLHALVERSVWGNPQEPYHPRFPCTSLMEKDPSRTAMRLGEVFLKKPLAFTDLCQLSELHAALAMVGDSMVTSRAREATPPPPPTSSSSSSPASKGFGVKAMDEEEEGRGGVLPLPVRASVARNGCPVFSLDFSSMENTDSTGLPGMVRSAVEVLPLHLTFLLHHPVEEGGNPFRCCVAVDVLHLFHQLPSIFAHHLVRFRGGGVARNPFYAVRMPQWGKSMWYRVLVEVKRALVSAYMEKDASHVGLGRSGGNRTGMSDADRLFLQQELLANCVLETFEVDAAYCLALSRWRIASLKRLANAECGSGFPVQPLPITSSPPVTHSGGEVGAVPAHHSAEESPGGRMGEKEASHERGEAGVPSRTAPEMPSSSTLSVLHVKKTSGQDCLPPYATHRRRSSTRSTTESATTGNERMKGIQAKHAPWEDAAATLPVAPGPRVYYPLDMQTLFVSASIAVEQNNTLLFPRVTQLRARYAELKASFHPGYSVQSSHRNRVKTPHSSDLVGLPRMEEWNQNVENTHFSFATAMQQWSVVQQMLDTENLYQLCLQQIYLNELSISNFNAHVIPYNTYRAKENILWGALYRSGLRLAYALCVYLACKPLHCMPDSFTVLFYPLAQFAGCAGGYREMKANLKAVKTSISERCRRVSMAVEMMTVDVAEKLLQEAVDVLHTQCQTASQLISCQAVEEDVLTTSISLVPLSEKTFLDVDLLTE